MFLNAATIGLVISLAKPHNANSSVTRIKEPISSLGTTADFESSMFFSMILFLCFYQ